MRIFRQASKLSIVIGFKCIALVINNKSFQTNKSVNSTWLKEQPNKIIIHSKLTQEEVEKEKVEEEKREEIPPAKRFTLICVGTLFYPT